MNKHRWKFLSLSHSDGTDKILGFVLTGEELLNFRFGGILSDQWTANLCHGQAFVRSYEEGFSQPCSLE